MFEFYMNRNTLSFLIVFYGVSIQKNEFIGLRQCMWQLCCLERGDIVVNALTAVQLVMLVACLPVCLSVMKCPCVAAGTVDCVWLGRSPCLHLESTDKGDCTEATRTFR